MGQAAEGIGWILRVLGNSRILLGLQDGDIAEGLDGLGEALAPELEKASSLMEEGKHLELAYDTDGHSSAHRNSWLVHCLHGRDGGGRRPVMNRAVFLDRDGTLIEHEPYLLAGAGKTGAGAAEALLRLRALNFWPVVVTNQSGVARGYFSESAVKGAPADK